MIAQYHSIHLQGFHSGEYSMKYNWQWKQSIIWSGNYWNVVLLYVDTPNNKHVVIWPLDESLMTPCFVFGRQEAGGLTWRFKSANNSVELNTSLQKSTSDYNVFWWRLKEGLFLLSLLLNCLFDVKLLQTQDKRRTACE